MRPGNCWIFIIRKNKNAAGKIKFIYIFSYLKIYVNTVVSKGYKLHQPLLSENIVVKKLLHLTTFYEFKLLAYEEKY